ncbi:MAG TPA: response regulator [Limnochordia bacterium]|nr:response regulator [Limnochordia bacterium]
MVLVIDDNRDLANLFCEYLNHQDYPATAAYSGEQGITIAKEQEPKVILCDIAMAGMDGYEVARCIRGDDSLRHIRLIAVSGYASQADVERSLQAGFDQHLCKPVDLTEMMKMLDDFLA